VQITLELSKDSSCAPCPPAVPGTASLARATCAWGHRREEAESRRGGAGARGEGLPLGDPPWPDNHGYVPPNARRLEGVEPPPHFSQVKRRSAFETVKNLSLERRRQTNQGREILPCSSRRMLSGFTSLGKEERLQQDEISVRSRKQPNHKKPATLLSIRN